MEDLELKTLILDLANDSVFVYDNDGNIIYVNKTAYESRGYTRDELMSMNRFDLVSPEYVDSFRTQINKIREGGKVIVESVDIRNDGTPMPVEARAVSGVVNGRNLTISIVRDITRRKEGEKKLKKYQEHLEELAVRDGLTGLYNYREFYRQLRDEIKRAKRYGRHLSLLMIDIDYFKTFNDTYGHEAGNNVLVTLSSWLQRDVRDVDHVARYGGEEFTVIMPETSTSDAFAIAERLREAVSVEAIAINEEQTVNITVSIGVAAFPEDAVSEEELVNAADHAMYLAKKLGRNQVCTASPQG